MTSKPQQERSPFNFDAWKKLAEKDPQAFEEMRKKVVKAEIAKAPKSMQHRLTGMQWRVDMERKRCSNPTQSMIYVYKKMWNSVYGENGLLSALHGSTADQQMGSGCVKLAAANILPFVATSGDKG